MTSGGIKRSFSSKSTSYPNR